MAMLAEPRQKKRYHLTPKGKPLFEDGDRFGTKMLEKMGWSKGKGLGKGEDGSQDFIRVKYKSDERGLGYQDRDDQWTEHDKNFNGLLANLNGETEECPEDFEIVTPTVGLGFATKSSKKKKQLKDKISGQSLEEKSKKSKARVHYQKFTKGKDMTQYSEKDLANIFGKKATTEDTSNIYSQFQAFNASESENDVKEEVVKEIAQEMPEKSGTPIINTGVSVNDYFKAKMAALKEKNGTVSGNPFNGNVRIINNVEMVVAKRKRSTDTEVTDSEELKNPSKKKKSKTTKNEESDPIVVAEECVETENHVPRKKKKSKKQQEDTEAITTIEDETSNEESQKKKKKSKKDNLIEHSNEENMEVEVIEKANQHQIASIEEPSNSEESHKKKKKSKKNNKIDPTRQENGEVELIDEANQNQTESNSEDSNSSKKKKKKSKEVPEESIETTCALSEEIPKKKKNKDKKKFYEETENHPSPTTIPPETTKESTSSQNINETIPIKGEEKSLENDHTTKSKKKKKNKTTDAEVSSPPQTDLTTLTIPNNNFLDTTYTISTFCAEKFRNIELHKFQGSILSDLSGYGLSTNIQLVIKNLPNDVQRITKLWNGSLNKYTSSTAKYKVYSSYMKKVKEAKKKRQSVPTFNMKSIKRQHVFQCI